MPMKRTERLGSISSGMPDCWSPMTPCSASPVLMQMIDVVRASLTGILSHGKIGTPRQADTAAFAAERRDGLRVGEEELRTAAAREQFVHVVGAGHPVVGLEALPV